MAFAIWMQWWDELTFMFRYWFSYIWVIFAFNTKYAYALTFNPSQLSTLCNGYILQNKKKIYAEQKEKTNLQGNTTYDSIFSYNCPFSFNNLTYLLEVVVCWSKQSWYKMLSVSCTATTTQYTLPPLETNLCELINKRLKAIHVCRQKYYFCSDL